MRRHYCILTTERDAGVPCVIVEEVIVPSCVADMPVTTPCNGFAEAEGSCVEDSGRPIELDAFPSAGAALDALTPPDVTQRLC